MFRVGFIGLGRRGRGLLAAAIENPDCQVVALCDLHGPNLELAKKQAPDAKVYEDFRDLIAAPDIDAIGIGTPDHWHAYMTVEACKAGKDVYVEKPISVTVHEGQMMVKAARKYDRIVQVGTQQRSGDHFQHVVEMIRADEIGDISFVRTWNFGNEFPSGIGNPPDADPPEGLDWDMWLGPAPERPFNANRFGVNDRIVFALPLVLGLRRRHDDRLGRAPARHRAVGDGPARADSGGGVRRQVRARRQSRDAGHDHGLLRVPHLRLRSTRTA